MTVAVAYHRYREGRASRTRLTSFSIPPPPTEPQTATSNALGLRARALLEVLYASGLRISELVGINIEDVELRARLVKVRGKGSKERIVPFGSKAEASIREWLAVRGKLASDIEEPALFVNYRAQRLPPHGARRQPAHAARRASLPAGVSPHTMPHAFATHRPNARAERRGI